MVELAPNTFRQCAAAPALAAMTGQLDEADQLTEQAFLLVGRQVEEGHRRALILAELAGGALQPDAAETAEQTVARLQLLTEHVAMWLADAGAQSRAICTILNTLEQQVDALSVPLRGLTKVVKTLHALRVATRIEAARSHGQGALVLGEELQNLGKAMQEKLGQIAERCELLATLRRRAAGVEEQAQAGPLNEAEIEIRQARLLLGSVASQCVGATDRTVRLQHRSAALAGSFGELVAALQFQDITRQRLQHISEALDGLSTASDGAIATDPAVAEICQLQHDQMQLAIGEFDGALVRLDENLLGMADHVQALADGTCAALSAGSNEDCARIAPSLQAVTRCLENVQITHLAAGQAVFAVCQAVRDVAGLTGEIELLGEEMQLLAQNAAVSAAHEAVQAVGLTVIAGNIQALAEESGRLAVAMAGGCGRISEQAEELDARDQQFDSREANLGVLLDEARILIERLNDGRQALDARIATIGQQAVEIGAGLQMARAGIDIRRQFLARVEPVLAGLLALVREHGGAARLAGDGHALSDLQKHYTMMSERVVHQRFLQQHADRYTDGARPVADAPLHNFGDNVDLF